MAASVSLCGANLLLGLLAILATAGYLGSGRVHKPLSGDKTPSLARTLGGNIRFSDYQYRKFLSTFPFTLFSQNNDLLFRRKTLDLTPKVNWSNYNYGSWQVDEGNVTIEGTKVQCFGGHGYLYRPQYLEDERKKHNNLSDVWQRPWNPDKGKFLLPFCKKGRISNHIRCYRGAMLIAGLLNRTLIQPLHVDLLGMDLSPFFDVRHMRSCFGENTVLSYDEYLERHGSPVVIDHIICVESGSCVANNRHMERAHRYKEWYVDAVLSPNITQWYYPRENEDIPKTTEFLVENYANIGEGVLHFHTQHFLQYFDSPYFKDAYVVDAPFQKRGNCTSNLALQPPPPIIRAAQKYIKNDIGHKNFMSIHLRLGDFRRYCSGGNTQCNYEVDEISTCIHRQLARSNLSFVFLATNGDHEEIEKIELSDSEISGRHITFFDFRLKGLNRKEDWARALKREGFDISLTPVQVAFEKMVCALSLVYLGSVSSSFSTDIMRLRYGLGTATCADDFYCGPAKGPKVNGDFL